MQRADLLTRLRTTERWNIIIIGGGATGLGIAVDAASRGYTTLLLEAHDFAKGTSSRSTKLVHGGVRYLAQGNIGLVREALHERGILHRNAPHLTHALPFVIPAYRWWEQAYYGIGLTLYDLLAGKLGIGATRLISREQTLQQLPTIEPKGLHGGIVYYDGQFDDARLAITLMRTALDQGGIALNYMPVTGFLKSGTRIAGVHARDSESGETLELRADVVINATGVYVDAIRQMDDPQAAPMLSPSQGVHIVLDRSFLPGDSALMIPHTDDGRVLFVIPWHGRVLVGTTDTSVTTTAIEPRPMQEEIAFLLGHAARYLSKDPLPSDVRSIFAGLRPLVKANTSKRTAALARDHTLHVAPSSLITITGGKWTTYRHMAEQTVDKAIEVATLSRSACQTKTLKLRGWQQQNETEPFTVYGSDATDLQQLLDSYPGAREQLHPNLPYLVGEVVWAARYELARTVEDVLARRTRALLLDARASQEAAPIVARVLAVELGFDEAWQQGQVEAYRELAQGYRLEFTS